jgi:hypothetical protein
MAGLWKQHEIKDGTYSYVDLLDVLEAMNVDVENRYRDFDAQRRDAE